MFLGAMGTAIYRHCYTEAVIYVFNLLSSTVRGVFKGVVRGVVRGVVSGVVRGAVSGWLGQVPCVPISIDIVTQRLYLRITRSSTVRGVFRGVVRGVFSGVVRGVLED